MTGGRRSLWIPHSGSISGEVVSHSMSSVVAMAEGGLGKQRLEGGLAKGDTHSTQHCCHVDRKYYEPLIRSEQKQYCSIKWDLPRAGFEKRSRMAITQGRTSSSTGRRSSGTVWTRSIAASRRVAALCYTSQQRTPWRNCTEIFSQGAERLQWRVTGWRRTASTSSAAVMTRRSQGTGCCWSP